MKETRATELRCSFRELYLNVVYDTGPFPMEIN